MTDTIEAPTLLRPQTEAQAADMIRAARARTTPLTIEGGGTRAGLGRPAQGAQTLSTRALAGLTLYEPAEMVFSARAGTPLAEIEAALDAKGQMLPFEPMDHRTLLGTSGEPTIGGVAACAVSGPRRVKAGAARDHLIGVRFINGDGETLRSGGRVMKNVTGLDLVKLSCGAYGTLGLLTEVTFKVSPKPQRVGTLIYEGLDDARAIAAMAAALGSPFEISGAAHTPAHDGAAARTLLRLEHFAPSVDYRLGEIEKRLASFGRPRRVDGEEAQALWRDVRDVAALTQPREGAIWRLSLPASHAAPVVAALRAQGVVKNALYDWGGGLVWLASEARGDAGAQAIRATLAQQGGSGAYATLVRAPSDLRASVDVFQPQPETLMKLTRGVKASFDPAGLFNPGRMYAGV